MRKKRKRIAEDRAIAAASIGTTGSASNTMGALVTEPILLSAEAKWRKIMVRNGDRGSGNASQDGQSISGATDVNPRSHHELHTTLFGGKSAATKTTVVPRGSL